MIELQNPQIPPPMQAIEIDKAIYQLQTFLDTKIIWLTHAYGRAYRFLDKNGKRLYFPEVYKGNYGYYRVTPDNDKQGTCFFLVGKEENPDYFPNQTNNLHYKVSIMFWVNLKKINETLAVNEIFTQNLIRDVRNVLTMQGGRLDFSFKIDSIEREFKEIYKEFTLDETEDYMRSPYDAFRVNLSVVLPEFCGALGFDPLQALVESLSLAEQIAVLQSLDFSDPNIFNALTAQQKADLGI